MTRSNLIVSLGLMASSPLCFAGIPDISAPSISYTYEHSAQELKQEQQALTETILASQKIINNAYNLTQKKETK